MRGFVFAVGICSLMLVSRFAVAGEVKFDTSGVSSPPPAHINGNYRAYDATAPHQTVTLSDPAPTAAVSSNKSASDPAPVADPSVTLSIATPSDDTGSAVAAPLPDAWHLAVFGVAGVVLVRWLRSRKPRGA